MATFKSWDLAREVSEHRGWTKKDAEEMINFIFNTVAKELQNGNSVKINKFGTFSTKVKPPRKAYSPAKSEFVDVPERTVVKFRNSFEV